VLLGGAGNDSLYDGDSGSNELYGGDGDDSVSSYYGNDYLSGGNGNDRLGMYGGDYVADGGAGNDTLDGSRGNMQLSGGAGDDTLLFKDIGSTGLFGGSGRDLLHIETVTAAAPYQVVASGGAGDDTIEMVRKGNSAITATGGEGADIYELSGASRLDSLTIKDFVVGAGGDRIDLSGLFTGEMGARDPYAAGVLLLVGNGSATVITLDRDGTAGPDTGYVLATVHNVTPAGIKDSIVYSEPAPLELVGVAPAEFPIG
jgi:Ca2+-binding RTX toxin-like protein